MSAGSDDDDTGRICPVSVGAGGGVTRPRSNGDGSVPNTLEPGATESGGNGPGASAPREGDRLEAPLRSREMRPLSAVRLGAGGTESGPITGGGDVGAASPPGGRLRPRRGRPPLGEASRDGRGRLSPARVRSWPLAGDGDPGAGGTGADGTGADGAAVGGTGADGAAVGGTGADGAALGGEAVGGAWSSAGGTARCGPVVRSDARRHPARAASPVTVVSGRLAAPLGDTDGGRGALRRDSRRGASSGTVGAPGPSTFATPNSTRSRTARETLSSLRSSEPARSPTDRAVATATTDRHRSESMVTSSDGSSLARATRWSRDGTTASSSVHSLSRAPARRRSPSTSSGCAASGVPSSLSNANDPLLNRRSSKTTSSVGAPSAERSATASTTEPSRSQTLPCPRSPSSRSRPVLVVVASSRRTSGSENVSR